MSAASDFWMYADETMPSARPANNEEDRHAMSAIVGWCTASDSAFKGSSQF